MLRQDHTVLGEDDASQLLFEVASVLARVHVPESAVAGLALGPTARARRQDHCATVRVKLRSRLQPFHQYALSTRAGAEALVHTLHARAQGDPSFFFVFSSAHLVDVRKVQVPVQPANYEPRRLGRGRGCVMQHVRAWRVLCARKGASNVRRSEQRGSKRALQSHAQEAPTLPSRKAQGGRSALGSEAHELSDEAKRLSTPRSSNFTGEDTESLRPRP